MMAIARGINRSHGREPGVITIISVNSPRRFDEAMADGLMTMAEHGQPVVITPFTLMGAMAPVTLAAALAQQNAEALAGMVLAQLVRPGAPVMYGAFTSNVDMRSGAPAFGTPENMKANVAGGQLARRYRPALPHLQRQRRQHRRRAGRVRDADVALGRGPRGRELRLPRGGLEGRGPDRIVREDRPRCRNVADDDGVPAAHRRRRAVRWAWRRCASVPTGGHYFGCAHTLERYEHAFYQPMVSDWQNYESWELAGARTATQRANEIWQRRWRTTSRRRSTRRPGGAGGLVAPVASRTGLANPDRPTSRPDPHAARDRNR